jgi:two-component system chemotaxis response regulator CheB
MPLSAIQNVEVRRVLHSTEIAGVLADLVHETVDDPDDPPNHLNEPPNHLNDPPNHPNDPPNDPDVALVGASLQQQAPPGAPSGYTCPECGGAMWEIRELDRLLRFRCHVGHGFTAESLSARQEFALEAAMWTALRALEEHSALCRRMAERAEERKLGGLASRYRRDADEGAARADVIRSALERAKPGAADPSDADAIEQMHPADAPPLAPSPAPLTTTKSK